MPRKHPQIFLLLLVLFWGLLSCSTEEEKEANPPQEASSSSATVESSSSKGEPSSSTAEVAQESSNSDAESSSSEISSSAKESSSSAAEKVRVKVKNASGSGVYAPGESIVVAVNREKLEGRCFAGFHVSPSKFQKNLKILSEDTAYFEVPDKAVKIQAKFNLCFSNVPSVVIGKLRWMTKNLNVWTLRGSSCYQGKSENCTQFGRLYTFEKAQSVCSSGWRLPTDAEWESLTQALGENAGTKLKSKTDWASDDGDPGNGTDSIGFNALPSGIVYEDNFMYLGHHAYFWTATERNAESAYYRSLSYNSPEIYRYYNFKSAGYAVRCVQDVP